MRLIKRGWQCRWLPQAMIVMMGLLAILPQLITGSTIVGTDGIFHFNRIYDTAKQISALNFSYFQMNYGFQQSGRVINAVYGPYFAYLAGLLLVICRSWYHFQLVTTFAVYVIGGWGMYRLAQTAGARRNPSLVAALIFMNVGWLPRWGLDQNMSGVGAAILPYVIACGVVMVKRHDRPMQPIKLALLMAVLCQTHVLSTLMAFLILIPFWIIGLVHAESRSKMIRDTAVAVGITVVLSANVWGALLSLYSHNSLALPHASALAHNTLKLTWLRDKRRTVSRVLIMLFTGQLGILIVMRKRISKVNWLLSGLGFLVLWTTTGLFPWHLVHRLVPVLSSVLQFPVRLTVLAYPLLLCGLALTFSQPVKPLRLKRWVMLGAVLTTGVLIGTNVHQIAKTSVQVRHHRVLRHLGGTLLIKRSPEQLRQALSSQHPGILLQLAEKHSGDYLPVKHTSKKGSNSPSNLYEQQILWGHQFYKFTVLSGGRLEVQWRASTQLQYVIPVVTYYDSSLTLNGKTLSRSEYGRTHINAPIVWSKKGVNTLILKYETPVGVSGLLWVSAFSWLGFAAYGGRRGWRRYRAFRGQKIKVKR
ncbi:hypothetical protein [Secundilactobacillus paracollinoides]|uniref:hypothetical protein n=1 Tax=Secundilactobacillus paracollinoides TaxID=240427 RepID=UPI000A596D89|nr:hypothetical protein [Secundilactobacillus paracollinoides]